jgi:molecular chaperone GrpE
MRKKKMKAESDYPEIEDIQPAGQTSQVGDADASAELATLAQERDGLLDQLLRKQAEFENYRKRMVRERMDARLAAQEEVLKEVLPVLDACERGLQSFDAAGDDDASRLETFHEGYELLLKSLLNLLARFGVTPVPGAGEPFDPAHHEAVQRVVTTDLEDSRVLDEFRKGYLFQGRLLRPSQVRVTAKPEGASSD